MNVVRFEENPLIRPADVPPSRGDFEVACVFNAGVAQFRGETILLLRVDERPISDRKYVRVPVLHFDGPSPVMEVRELDRSDASLDFSDTRMVKAGGQLLFTTIPHLRVARSADGRHFQVENRPALWPQGIWEAFGVSDSRITEIDGTYYIAYKSVGPAGIATSLATTRDFVSFSHEGIIFCPENLDVCIFPGKVKGRYAALHRPVPRMLGEPNIWVAYSSDLRQWGDHRFLMGVRKGLWDSGRIGAGAVPIKTPDGWLEIYHGATEGDFYCLGTALLDLEEPHKVLARCREPLMVPRAPYEKEGFFPNVIFACGATVAGDRVTIYYGAADMVMAAAEVSLRAMLDALS